MGKRKYFYGYVLDADKFWSSLRRELENWLPPSGAETVINQMIRRTNMHFALYISLGVKSMKEAERVAEKRPEETKATDWSPVAGRFLEEGYLNRLWEKRWQKR